MNQKVKLTDEQALKKANSMHYDNQADQVDWLVLHAKKREEQRKSQTVQRKTPNVHYAKLSFEQLEELYIDTKDRLTAYRELPINRLPALAEDVRALGRKLAALRIWMQKKASPVERNLLTERKHLTQQLHFLNAENKKLHEENKRLQHKLGNKSGEVS